MQAEKGGKNSKKYIFLQYLYFSSSSPKQWIAFLHKKKSNECIWNSVFFGAKNAHVTTITVHIEEEECNFTAGYDNSLLFLCLISKKEVNKNCIFPSYSPCCSRHDVCGDLSVKDIHYIKQCIASEILLLY